MCSLAIDASGKAGRNIDLNATTSTDPTSSLSRAFITNPTLGWSLECMKLLSDTPIAMPFSYRTPPLRLLAD
jgi:hypothetical protein